MDIIKKIFRKNWHDSSDPYKRMATVRKINPMKNRRILIKIAKKDPDVGVRSEAVKRLGPFLDHNLINFLLKNEKSEKVRASIVDNLNSYNHSEMLKDILKNDESVRVRIVAVNRLDQNKHLELLKDIAKESNHPLLQMKAIDRIDPHQNQELLLDIVNNNSDKSLRTHVAHLLDPEKNKGLIFSIVKEAPHLWDADTPFGSDATLLHFAAKTGNFEIVKILIDQINSSCESEYMKVYHRHFDRPMNMDRSEFSVRTIYHDRFDNDVRQCVLEHISSKDLSGKTPRELAFENGHFKVAELFNITSSTDILGDLFSKNKHSSIKVFQENCNHFWEKKGVIGGDHMYQWKECKLCGKKESLETLT